MICPHCHAPSTCEPTCPLSGLSGLRWRIKKADQSVDRNNVEGRQLASVRAYRDSLTLRTRFNAESTEILCKVHLSRKPGISDAEKMAANRHYIAGTLAQVEAAHPGAEITHRVNLDTGQLIIKVNTLTPLQKLKRFTNSAGGKPPKDYGTTLHLYRPLPYPDLFHVKQTVIYTGEDKVVDGVRLQPGDKMRIKLSSDSGIPYTVHFDNESFKGIYRFDGEQPVHLKQKESNMHICPHCHKTCTCNPDYAKAEQDAFEMEKKRIQLEDLREAMGKSFPVGTEVQVRSPGTACSHYWNGVTEGLPFILNGSILVWIRQSASTLNEIRRVPIEWVSRAATTKESKAAEKSTVPTIPDWNTFADRGHALAHIDTIELFKSNFTLGEVVYVKCGHPFGTDYEAMLAAYPTADGRVNTNNKFGTQGENIWHIRKMAGQYARPPALIERFPSWADVVKQIGVTPNWQVIEEFNKYFPVGAEALVANNGTMSLLKLAGKTARILEAPSMEELFPKAKVSVEGQGIFTLLVRNLEQKNTLDISGMRPLVGKGEWLRPLDQVYLVPGTALELELRHKGFVTNCPLTVTKLHADWKGDVDISLASGTLPPTVKPVGNLRDVLITDEATFQAQIARRDSQSASAADTGQNGRALTPADETEGKDSHQTLQEALVKMRPQDEVHYLGHLFKLASKPFLMLDGQVYVNIMPKGQLSADEHLDVITVLADNVRPADVAVAMNWMGRIITGSKTTIKPGNEQ